MTLDNGNAKNNLSPAEQFSAWWEVVSKPLYGFAGLAVILYETIQTQIDRPWLLAAAIGLTGKAGASYLLDKLGSKGGGEEK